MYDRIVVITMVTDLDTKSRRNATYCTSQPVYESREMKWRRRLLMEKTKLETTKNDEM